MKKYYYILVPFWVYLIGQSVYTIVTGKVPFSNIHYSVPGRVMNAVILGVGIWFGYVLFKSARKHKDEI